MATLLRASLSLLAVIVGVLAAWYAVVWGMAHYSLQAPFVASCHTKVPDATKCLVDSAQALIWHNFAPAATRFLLVAGLGAFAVRGILRLRDSLFGFRW